MPGSAPDRGSWAGKGTAAGTTLASTLAVNETMEDDLYIADLHHTRDRGRVRGGVGGPSIALMFPRLGSKRAPVDSFRQHSNLNVCLPYVRVSHSFFCSFRSRWILRREVLGPSGR
jgi:hypothetical protein